MIKRVSWAFPWMLILYETATYLANDMYLPGLPDITRDFKIDQDQAQWTLMIWFIGAASVQLILGPLSDRYGRRIILVLASGLFCIASIMCGVTTDLQVLYFFRFIQGMCISAISVAGYASIHELYDTKTAMYLITFMTTVTLLAPAFGPLLGAGIIVVSNWRWIFYVLAFMGGLSFLGLCKWMVESKIERDPILLGPIVKDYIKITCNRKFLIYTLVECFQFMIFIAWIVESPFIILETYKKSQLEYGILQLCVFGMLIIGSSLLRPLLRVLSVKRLIDIGVALLCVGVFGLWIMNVYYIQHLYATVAWLMLASLGLAFCYGPLNRGAVEACQEPMGRRMAVLSTISSLSGVAATYIVTLYNDSTLDNLSWVLMGAALASLVVWLGGGLLDQPKKNPLARVGEKWKES